MDKQDIKDVRSEDLGSMGESFFNTLCKSIGFIANSSKSDDKGGWDFEVEHRKTNNIDYSNQSYPVYRVQVKSTKGKNQTKLTYSNLIKLIQYNGPSFIALLKYTDNISPEHIFLFHVDEVFSKAIWREVRKKEIELKNFALNKNEKTIRFNSKHKISPSNGSGLQKKIVKYIGSDYLGYVKSKLSYLSKFEREGERRQFVWSFKDKKELRSMANCFLGYNEKFKIDCKEFKAPFGVADKLPFSTINNLRTTIVPKEDNLAKTKVIFKFSKFGRQYEFLGKSYMVPEQLQQFSFSTRKECALFDFCLDDRNKSLLITSKDIFNEDIKVTFKELYNFICFLQDSTDCKEVYIKLVDIKSNKSVQVCLNPPNFSFPDDFQRIYDSICFAYKKLCELNLELREISTKFVWDNMGRFYLFSIVDKEFDPNFNISFRYEGNDQPDADMVIFRSELDFGESKLVTFVAFFGTLTRVRKDMLLGSFNKSEFINDFLLTNDTSIEEFLETKSQEFEKAYIDRGFRILKSVDKDD